MAKSVLSPSNLDFLMRKRSKKILMLLENNCFPNDTRVLLEARSLVEGGFDVTVISPTGSYTKWSDWVGDVKVYRYPAPPEWNGVLGYVVEYAYSFCMALLISIYVLFRRGFDAIHVHSPPDLNSLIPFLYRALGKKSVFDMHDLSPELYQAQKGGQANGLLISGLRFFERFACRWGHKLISTNQTQRSVQIDRCGADATKCHIVRNGPNKLFLEDVQPSLEVYDDKLTIGYVGLIGFQDGVDYLVRAIAALKRMRASGEELPGFQCVIVGDGPAMPELRKLVSELQVSNEIVFAGMVDFSDVPSYISAFDVCVTPDPSNPYNDSCTTIKTMEYMALRKPIVCFETHENRVTAGEAALYARDSDCKDLARQIAILLSDPEMRHTMGQIGRTRIENGLTWSHQAVELVALYQELLISEPK
ncbi:MAG: glycosyltransferase family 4 protein [Aureliella sp.]